LRLRRGPILLIAGGAIVAVGFAIFSYYTVLFAAKLITESSYSIAPADKLSLQQSINNQNASEGSFIVAMQHQVGQPTIKINSPSGATLVEKQLIDSITMDTFAITETGTYTLTLTNASPDTPLEANIIFGDKNMIVERGLSISPETLSLVFNLTLYTAFAVIITGAIITILDRQRISKMKQFGDTSDLV
jgi:uncharacterized repeat protein (TIGR01451 family)